MSDPRCDRERYDDGAWLGEKPRTTDGSSALVSDPIDGLVLRSLSDLLMGAVEVDESDE